MKKVLSGDKNAHSNLESFLKSGKVKIFDCNNEENCALNTSQKSKVSFPLTNSENVKRNWCQSLDDLKGITDVDKNYFSFIKKQQKKFSRHTYKKCLNESLRLCLQTGFLFDDILKIYFLSERENDQFERILTSFKTFTTEFEMALSRDHEESMKLLIACTNESALTKQKRRIYTNKVMEVTKLNVEICNMEELWSKSKLCEQFLISINIFKIDKTFTGEYDNSENFDQRASVSSNLISSSSLYSLLRNTNIKDKIIFKSEHKSGKPMEVYELFSCLEYYNLNYLLLTNTMKQKNIAVEKEFYLLQARQTEEIDKIKNTIQQSLNSLLFIEERNKYLEAHLNSLIHNLYKNTFEESIIMIELVQQIYSNVIINDETYLSPVDILNELFEEYNNILNQMVAFPVDEVAKCVKIVREQTRKKLVIAKEAKKKLLEFDKCTRRIIKMCEPPFEKRQRQLMKRSLPPPEKKTCPISPDEITKDQLEYLYMFTDFCPYSDDAHSYLAQN